MIIRVEKNKNYTQINNTALRDKNLSWAAKGLFAYMMTNIDDWQFYVSELENHTTDSLYITRKTINELIDAGYLRKDIIRNKGKFDKHEYTLFEVPEHDVHKPCQNTTSHIITCDEVYSNN